jgi:hypothetical protein
MYEWNLVSWKNPEIRRTLLAEMQLRDERGYWGSIFDRCASRPAEQTTWDYQWTYTCWANHGLAVYPAVHLVQNIGQDGEGTHMKQQNSLFASAAARITLPLTHPNEVSEDARLSKEIFRAVFMSKRPWREKVWHGLIKRLNTIT